MGLDYHRPAYICFMSVCYFIYDPAMGRSLCFVSRSIKRNLCVYTLMKFRWWSFHLYNHMITSYIPNRPSSWCLTSLPSIFDGILQKNISLFFVRILTSKQMVILKDSKEESTKSCYVSTQKSYTLGYRMIAGIENQAARILTM